MAILRNQNAGGTLQQTNAGNMRNGGRVNRWTKPMMSRGGRTRPMMSRGGRTKPMMSRGRRTRPMMARGGLTLDVSKAKALVKRKRLNRSASSLRGRRPVSLRQHR
jgi:hypothetical protein